MSRGPVAPTAGAPAAGGSPAEGCWRWRGAGLGREPRDDRRRPGDPRSPPAAQKQVRTRRGHGCHVWRRPPSAVCLRWATCPPCHPQCHRDGRALNGNVQAEEEVMHLGHRHPGSRRRGHVPPAGDLPQTGADG